MTVLENVMVGRHVRTRSELFAVGFRLRAMRQEEQRIRDSAYLGEAIDYSDDYSDLRRPEESKLTRDPR
jgi:ABC-type branched-subunit amino acid transport system ATPase component